MTQSRAADPCSLFPEVLLRCRNWLPRGCQTDTPRHVSLKRRTKVDKDGANSAWWRQRSSQVYWWTESTVQPNVQGDNPFPSPSTIRSLAARERSLWICNIVRSS